jgi:hypothetical protein
MKNIVCYYSIFNDGEKDNRPEKETDSENRFCEEIRS